MRLFWVMWMGTECNNKCFYLSIQKMEAERDFATKKKAKWRLKKDAPLEECSFRGWKRQGSGSSPNFSGEAWSS